MSIHFRLIVMQDNTGAQGPSRAAKYGALAVIVRSMSHSTDNNPHTGATRYDSAYAKIPAVAIGLKDADFLSDRLANGKVSVFIQDKWKISSGYDWS